MRLDDEQIKLLQAFIDDTSPGEYDAMDLIPKEYLEYFRAPQAHGGEFYDAVKEKRLINIEFVGMARGSKHLRYLIKRETFR